MFLISYYRKLLITKYERILTVSTMLRKEIDDHVVLTGTNDLKVLLLFDINKKKQKNPW